VLNVLAIVTAKPGQKSAILEQYRRIVRTVRMEHGCLEYGSAVDYRCFGPPQTPMGDDVIVIIEKWTTAEALRAHAASTHMTAYAAATKDLIASRIIHVLDEA
jgi:quinol monooxygenase YgiN